MAITRWSTFKKWVLETIFPSETNTDKRTDVVRVQDIIEDVGAALGVKESSIFIENGSTDARAALKLANLSGTYGLLDSGNVMEVQDNAGRAWRPVVTANDSFEMGLAEQVAGTAKSTGYNAAGFIATLTYAYVMSSWPKVGKTQLAIAVPAGGNTAEAIYATDIPTSSTDSEGVGTKAAATETRVNQVITDPVDPADAVLADEVVDATHFAKTAFKAMAFSQNLVANGGCEMGPGFIGGAGGGGIGSSGCSAPFWSGPVAGREPPTYYMTDDEAYEGDGSLYLGFTAANQAYEFELDPKVVISQLAGKWVSLWVAVRSTVASKIKVGVYGGHTVETVSAAGGAATTWTVLTHTALVHASEDTTFKVIVVNDEAGANPTYIDAVMLVVGERPMVYVPSRWETSARKALDESQIDVCINGDMGVWTMGTAVAPDCWQTSGNCTVAREASSVYRGPYSAKVNIADNTGKFFQRIGYAPGNEEAEALRGFPLTATFRLKWSSGTKNLHATLFDTGGASPASKVEIIAPPASDWLRFAVCYLPVSLDAVDLWVQFENLDAGVGAIEFYIDDVQITPSPYPCGPIVAKRYSTVTRAWGYKGACAPSGSDAYFGEHGVTAMAMTNGGTQAGFFGTLIRMYVAAGTAPASTATYWLYANGSVQLGSVSLLATATTGQSHNSSPASWGQINPETLLGVKALDGNPSASDLIVRGVFLVINGDMY